MLMGLKARQTRMMSFCHPAPHLFLLKGKKSSQADPSLYPGVAKMIVGIKESHKRCSYVIKTIVINKDWKK